MRARQAAAFAAVEATGLSKSDIGRIAGVHRSQVSRWASGEQQPSYERTMRLAGYLRTEHPGLADELIAACGYGGEPGPEPLVHPELAESLRKHVHEDAERIIAELERRRAAPAPAAGQEAPGGQAAS
jgi:transcriptional regulator with XRE-family HTH domain